ncbi:MAG: ATP-binding protein [Bacteroidales bacterium]|nr:ATP-binding protein [Bacteroidales bacterium]
MKIKKLIINNFRAFKHAEIDFDDFSCIIGKNDTGKSTILAALEWFFNSNKELDENDFAAASFDWSECEHPAFHDEIAGETFQGETVKEFIYDGFCISVDVYFSDANLPNRTEESDFIFNHDFVLKDGNICISKYMYHPYKDINHPSIGKQMGYRMKNCFFEKMQKPFSDCTIEELKTVYNEIRNNADDLCKKLYHLEEERQNKKNRGVGTLAINTEIRDEVLRIKRLICSELYNHYSNKGEKTCEKWMPFDNIDSIEFHFGFDLPQFILYTSKTPTNDYLNKLFTPYNAIGLYKSIEKAKVHTTEKLSEFLNLNGLNENIHIKENEKIDLFTKDSLIFKHNDLPLNIPLKNRGEGFQLKIKNAVFRLLTETRTRNQINIIFAFEEPETHLHPSAQIEMYQTLKALSENINYQVIITTHSPYIVKN